MTQTQTPEMREAIARIIDPKTAAKIDKIMAGEMDGILPKGWSRIGYARSCYLEEINAANAKADAILALTSPLEGGGWVYWNPDTGEEYAPNHPILSGECPKAERVRAATAFEDQLCQAPTSAPQATNSEVERLLSRRAYMMSEPHLSGYRLIIGFETGDDALDAQTAIVALAQQGEQM